ncbi:glycosyltransferase EpsJ [Paenibacillus endophyticus]|uniref:Glycosyltransferase EpsJ n=1 Tax=Paenibacillus endophyticus TaxID=1294268 RepID=A0A7W5CC93_9BACL|nr:glycosyltransferase [Paenibacillus endophyticus]MBB3155061.1 glycosyltransferase EpsJ [Paenibacillus endophyticus]
MTVSISVILPIYNAEKWIRDCLDSIINQPFRHIELLLINDGSTDQSGAVCEAFAARDSRIRVMHKPNRGTSSARNIGLKAATGKYISFVDADDVIDELFFVKLYAAAEQFECETVICGYESLQKREEKPPQFTLHTVMNGKELVLSAERAHSGNELCFVWRCLFLRSLIEKRNIRFQEGLTIGEDMIFLLEVVLAADRVYAIPDLLYRYNTHNNADSLTRSSFRPHLEKCLILQYELRKRLSDKTGLLVNDRYRKDMASYYIGEIRSMLITNMKSNPEDITKADMKRILHLKMMTDSTMQLGFAYKCGSLKEYLYYIAFKYKLATLLFHFEFGRRSKPARRFSLFPGLFGRSKNGI